MWERSAHLPCRMVRWTRSSYPDYPAHSVLQRSVPRCTCSDPARSELAKTRQHSPQHSGPDTAERGAIQLLVPRSRSIPWGGNYSKLRMGNSVPEPEPKRANSLSSLGPYSSCMKCSSAAPKSPFAPHPVRAGWMWCW